MYRMYGNSQAWMDELGHRAVTCSTLKPHDFACRNPSASGHTTQAFPLCPITDARS